MIRWIGIALIFLGALDGVFTPHLTVDYEWLRALGCIIVGAGLVVLGRTDGAA